MPAPVKLRDEKWRACENGKSYCMSASEVKKVLENKAKIGQYIGRLRNNLEYYRSLDKHPEPSSPN